MDMNIETAKLSERLLGVTGEFGEAVYEKLQGDFEQGKLTNEQHRHYSSLLFKFETSACTLAQYLDADLLPLDSEV